MLIHYFTQLFNYTTHHQNLNNLGIQIIINSSKTIREIINNYIFNNHIKSEAGKYSTARVSCDKNYIGETSRLIKKRIYGYILYFKIGDDGNTI